MVWLRSMDVVTRWHLCLLCVKPSWAVSRCETWEVVATPRGEEGCAGRGQWRAEGEPGRVRLGKVRWCLPQVRRRLLGAQVPREWLGLRFPRSRLSHGVKWGALTPRRGTARAAGDGEHPECSKVEASGLQCEHPRGEAFSSFTRPFSPPAAFMLLSMAGPTPPSSPPDSRLHPEALGGTTQQGMCPFPAPCETGLFSRRKLSTPPFVMLGQPFPLLSALLGQ